jgi:hypothetical protein
MGNFIMPKHSGEITLIKDVLEFYNSKNDWVSNADLKKHCKETLKRTGDDSSHTKLVQWPAYFRFIEWQDPSTKSSPKRITDSGKRFLKALEDNDTEQMNFLLLESMENFTFGRNAHGVSSDSDYEAPNIAVRCALALDYFTKAEYQFILDQLVTNGKSIFDLISFVKKQRLTKDTNYPAITNTYVNDPKILQVLNECQFFIVDKKEYKLNKSLLEKYADRLLALKITNSEISQPSSSDEDETVILTNPLLKQIIFESFKYLLSHFGEENILKENEIKDTSIEGRKYKGLSLNKYFGFETLLGLFDVEQIPDNLKSSGTPRFINEKITVLGNENVYFTSQWNGKDNGRGLSLDNFNKFILEISNNKIKIIIEDNLYKLVFISHSFILTQNSIIYGSPGTGKSHKADKITNGKDVQKVTFHPDYDYHSFVGGYKPTMDGDKIAYKFVPQIFTKIYIDSWKNLVSADETKPFYLQIEEINRGNCAEIFGDLFQLLDRDKDGFSKYEVTAEEELYKYLLSADGFGGDHDGIKGGKLRFPSNLKIIATMNTSDQSLFPMDSAFKRRWDWIYVPIDYSCSFSDFTIQLDNGKAFKWLEFLKSVNKEIIDIDKNQDKQIGNWFIDAQNSGKIISESTFVNKVVFYLWNDVFKDEEKTIFKAADGNNLTYTSFFENDRSNNLVSYILAERLKLTNIGKAEPTTTDAE